MNNQATPICAQCAALEFYFKNKNKATKKPNAHTKKNSFLDFALNLLLYALLYVVKRLSEGLKQVDIAEELGIKQSSVSKLYARYQKQQKDGMRA
jgi:DNA-binding MarR family transcriptional regulator